MRQRNLDIREAAKEADIRLWQIADLLEISDSRFSRLLRYELDEECKDSIYSAINFLLNIEDY